MGESAAVKGLRPLRGAKAPLTLQYPGVHVNIVHPDSEPPLILCEAVGGSPPLYLFHKKRVHPDPFLVELMGGVEQINNSETIEISRKERRPSHSVSRSVSMMVSGG